MYPEHPTPRILVLGLGNDLLADDGVGWRIVQQLKNLYSKRAENAPDFILCSESGVSLLDFLIGYDKVLLVDAIQLHHYEIGECFEIPLQQLSKVQAASPHYTGLPELLAISDQLKIQFPKELRILVVNVSDVLTVGGSMTSEVQNAIPEAVRQCQDILTDWGISSNNPHR